MSLYVPWSLAAAELAAEPGEDVLDEVELQAVVMDAAASARTPAATMRLTDIGDGNENMGGSSPERENESSPKPTGHRTRR
jgi:hypothetical protein